MKVRTKNIWKTLGKVFLKMLRTHSSNLQLEKHKLFEDYQNCLKELNEEKKVVSTNNLRSTVPHELLRTIFKKKRFKISVSNTYFNMTFLERWQKSVREARFRVCLEQKNKCFSWKPCRECQSLQKSRQMVKKDNFWCKSSLPSLYFQYVIFLKDEKPQVWLSLYCSTAYFR